MKKSLFYLIPKILGIILVAPIVILVHVIAGFWEAIMTIYEAIKELREENKALKNQINDLKKKEKCDHSYEVTDSQGHDMECSKCGKLWRLYEN